MSSRRALPSIPMGEIGIRARARHRLIEVQLHPLKNRALQLQVIGQLQALLADRTARGRRGRPR